MCVCLHNCTVRACAHVWPICACVRLYNCTSMCAYICTMFMHVCVRLAKLMDQAEKILQLQVNSSCSARGIIAMQPRCGCTSVETLMETDFFRFFTNIYHCHYRNATTSWICKCVTSIYSSGENDFPVVKSEF